MVDLTAEMAQLWAALGPGPPGVGRVVQFVAATPGEGTSTVARELARFVSRGARRPVWLVDLDLARSPQYAAIAADPERFGALGRQSAASPDGSAFFTVQPPSFGPGGRVWPDARCLVAHPVGSARLWVTRFRREALRGDQAAHIIASGDYWQALRRHAELVVVDAPAADHARAALTLAPFVDSTVLVVAADHGAPKPAVALRDAITAAGGRCAGLVFNRAKVEQPAFLKKILP